MTSEQHESGEFFDSSSFLLNSPTVEDKEVENTGSRANKSHDDSSHDSDGDDNIVREIVGGNLENLRQESIRLEAQASTSILAGPLGGGKTRTKLGKLSAKDDSQATKPGKLPTLAAKRQTSGAANQAWEEEQRSLYQGYSEADKELEKQGENPPKVTALASKSGDPEAMDMTDSKVSNDRKASKKRGTGKEGFLSVDETDTSIAATNKSAELLLDIIENAQTHRTQLQRYNQHDDLDDVQPGAVFVPGRAFGARRVHNNNLVSEHAPQSEDEDLETIGVQVIRDADLEQEYRERVLEKEIVDATHVQAAQDSEEEPTFLQRQKWFLIMLVALVVGLAAVLIVVLGGGSGDGKDASLSSPPTIAPTLSPPAYLHQLVEPISGNATLETEGSSQHRALQWLSEEDELDVDIYDISNQLEITQRYVMAVFYYALGGENWFYSLNFLDGISVCEWSNQTDSSSGLQGIECDTEGQVLSIRLESCNLDGMIPGEIGFLPALEELSIVDAPNVTGSLPTELTGVAKTLHRVTIEDCSLSGSIPSDILKLTNVRNLNLQGNQLVGPIPPNFFSIGNTWARNVINFSNNQLTGPIPNFNTQADFRELNLSGNSFNGTIPPSLYTSLRMRLLDLSDNELTGTIGQQIIGMQRLEILSLNGNQFIGSIPGQIGNLQVYLTQARLNDNQLTGTIPSQLGELYLLEELNLSRNLLRGSLPDEFGNLESLRLLDVSANVDLTGDVPSSFLDLGELTSFCYDDTGVTGIDGIGDCIN